MRGEMQSSCSRWQDLTEEASVGQQKKWGWGDGRNEVQQRESTVNPGDNRFWAVSRGGWGALSPECWRSPATRLGSDGWQSAEGPKQKIRGYWKGSHCFQNDGIQLNDSYKIFWIERLLQKGRDRKYFSSSTKAKNVNALLKLIEITCRKWISE